tara:strand:- start:385 stop:1911 length:1527 start_codon:yes stop_codon:yes gene_type:complete
MSGLLITKNNFTIRDFGLSLQKPVHVKLSSDAVDSVNNSQKNLQSLLTSGISIYGVTTGFGKLSHVKIDPSDQRKLQLNLVRSHAAGVGQPENKGIIRVMMILKLLTFVKGYSGVRMAVLDQIIKFLNHDIIPVVPEKGSVGASGDLAQLAHMGLALIGEGDVFYKGKQTESKLIMDRLGIFPLELEPKEGISLINGTHYSTALAIAILNISKNLLQCADIIGALSVESSLSSRNIFNPKIHYLKKHPGQRDSAENIWNILSDSKIVSSHKECEKIQDPYSFRCIPHVHGASRDMINNAADCVNNEINSVSDNPLVFSGNEIQSSGHFHGEHIAQAMDSVGIAISEIGAISQKRIHYFMKGIENKIPPFLALNSGLESGYMLAQVTAGALASENKTLSHPASIDSTTTSAGQEDFVSMAPWAGQKASKIAENTATILSIELMVSATAAQLFLKDFQPSSVSREIFNEVNTFLKYDAGDRPLDKEIQGLKSLIISEKITKTVENIIDIK